MSPPHTESDCTRAAGLDEETLYRVIRNAVEDAILGVLGVILMLLIAAFFAWIGWLFILSESPLGIAFGVLFGGFGLYLGAATLGLIPTIREWIAARGEN